MLDKIFIIYMNGDDIGKSKMAASSEAPGGDCHDREILPDIYKHMTWHNYKASDQVSDQHHANVEM